MNTPFCPSQSVLLVAGAVAALTVVLSAAAQTGGGGEAAPSSSPQPQAVPASELTSHFVATAVPTTNFIATASRMAISKSRNAKIQQFAGPLAKDQSAIANSLAAWVNVNGPVVTLRSPYTGQIGAGATKLKAPNLLPAQVTQLASPFGLEQPRFRCAVRFDADGGTGSTADSLSRFYSKWHGPWPARHCRARIAEGRADNFGARLAIGSRVARAVSGSISLRRP